MDKWNEEYYRYYFALLREIEALYGNAYEEMAKAVAAAGIPSDVQFRFREYKRLNELADKQVKLLAASTTAIIAYGATHAWDLSNVKNDEFARAFIRDRKIPPHYMQHNLDKLTAFLNRKINGLTVSSRVWKYTEGLKGQLETAIDVAIKEGLSAAELSRSIRKYLNNPEALYRRVRDINGNLVPSKAMLAYSPGTGVYRSAYKNSLRLAGTSINQAYREADLIRWNQQDFVIGYKIQVSPRSATVCPLCQSFNNVVFPKDFVWVGFHPSCRCTATSILANQNEFISYLNGDRDDNFSGRITEAPTQLKKYIADNKDKIETAIERGKAPYFIEDNLGKYVKL